MQIGVKRLDEILDEEVRVFDELVQTCSEATTRILNGDLDGLAKVTRRQNELVMAAAEVGKERFVLQRELVASSKHVQDTDPQPALPFITEPHASRFAEHGLRLRSSVDKLREHSEHNRLLLAFSLHMVDRAMLSVYDNHDEPLTYQSSDSNPDRPSSKSGLFDKEA